MNGADELQKLLEDTIQIGHYILITPNGNMYKGTPVELMRLLIQHHPYLFAETEPNQPPTTQQKVGG